MIGNMIYYIDGLNDNRKARVIDKILVIEEMRKQKTQGQGAYGSGFASSTRYLCVNLDNQSISIIKPRQIKKIL